jgi:drug/metabolite transporter (DMT)-like permease
MTDPKATPMVELALLCLLALLWGSSYLLIKVAVATIAPVTLIAARVTIAAGFLLMVICWSGERLPRDGRTWRRLFVQSVFNSIGAWTVLAWGQQHIDSGLASVLNSTSPIFVFLFTLLVTRHEATDGMKLLGAGLGMLGVTLTVGIDALDGLGRQVAAQLAVLLGAVLYACAAIYGRSLSHLSPTVAAADGGGRGDHALGIRVPRPAESGARPAMDPATVGDVARSRARPWRSCAPAWRCSSISG